MKRFTLALVTLCLFMVAVPAAAGDKSKTFSFDAREEVWSNYLNQGGGIVHEGSVLWSSLFMTHNPTGLYVGVWNSMPVDGTRVNSDGSTENDIYLGHRGKKGAVGYTLGVGYFDLVKIGGTPAGDLVQAYGEVNYHIGSGNFELVPFVRAEYVIPPVGSSTMVNSSVRGLVGAAWAYELTHWATPKAKLWLIGDDGRNFPEPAGIAQLDLGMSFKLTKNVSIDLNTKFSQPLTRTKTRKTEFIHGIGLNFSW